MKTRICPSQFVYSQYACHIIYAQYMLVKQGYEFLPFLYGTLIYNKVAAIL